MSVRGVFRDAGFGRRICKAGNGNGAVLVGEQTFGKGIGQTTRRLSDGSYIKFTTFKYFTAAHVDFNGIGLTPDIEVLLTTEKRANLYNLSLEEDDQLYAAWNAVKG